MGEKLGGRENQQGCWEAAEQQRSGLGSQAGLERQQRVKPGGSKERWVGDLGGSRGWSWEEPGVRRGQNPVERARSGAVEESQEVVEARGAEVGWEGQESKLG